MSSYGLWLSAAGMQVSEHRQTLVANNMANAGTTGFKHDLAVVTQRRIESASSAGGAAFASPLFDGLVGGLDVRPTQTDFTQGPIERTERPLDVAIDGDGFFSVSDGTATRYTRDGAFALNTAGELVLATEGGRWRVLDDAGGRITVVPAAGSPSIAQDGTIRQGETVVAKLGLFDTPNRQSLRKVGENLFTAGDTEMTATAGRFAARSREGANLEVTKGLVTMIEAARAYQLNATMLQLQDQATGQAVSAVGRFVA